MTRNQSTRPTIDDDKKLNVPGLLNLLVIYIVWGSTYLAIRIAVRDGSGFSPFFLGGTRIGSAGILLLLWSIFKRKRLRLNPKELIHLIVLGISLWIGGNGLVTWAEQRTESGLAALIIAAVPIWTAIIAGIIDRKPPTIRMIGALLVGFMGMAVLSVPVFKSGVQADIWSIFGLLVAGISWSIGSVLQGRTPMDLSTEVSAGYQQLFGGVGLIGLGLILNEPYPNPITEAWFAWGYLLIFGSILAYTSFVRALRLLPTKIVMTYPYVNPIIAVFLGWIILNESVSIWTLGGAGLVLVGVAGVFRERYRSTGK